MWLLIPSAICIAAVVLACLPACEPLPPVAAPTRDGAPTHAYVEHRDEAGMHYSTRAIGDAFATEYVVPADPHSAVLVRVVDVHKADAVVRREACFPNHDAPGRGPT